MPEAVSASGILSVDISFIPQERFRSVSYITVLNSPLMVDR